MHQGRRLPPVPDDIPRREQRLLSQLRAGKSPVLGAYLHSSGKADTAICQACYEAPETAKHLLLTCPAWSQARIQLSGCTPTVTEVFESTTQLMAFLKRIGLLACLLGTCQDGSPGVR